MPLPDKFVVSGTPEQIAMQLPILQAMYLGFKELEASGGGVNRPPVSPDFEDWLQITLHWRGTTIDTGKNHTVEKSFRLIGVNPRDRNLVYFQTLGRQIIAKFDNKNFRTGHVKCKYVKWKDGMHTWGYFDSQTTGYQIIEAMGDIANKPIDKGRFKYEFVLEGTEVFDPTPDKIQLAGKLVRPRAKAPIADMHWYGATVLFPWIGHSEQLCNRFGYVMKDLAFLNAYDD
jgi:hypothetical protein